MAEKGRPLPKFGEWDVNDPASAEGFTVIFNKARNEKKTGGKVESPPKDNTTFKRGHGAVLGKPQSAMLSHRGKITGFREVLHRLSIELKHIDVRENGFAA